MKGKAICLHLLGGGYAVVSSAAPLRFMSIDTRAEQGGTVKMEAARLRSLANALEAVGTMIERDSVEDSD